MRKIFLFLLLCGYASATLVQQAAGGSISSSGSGPSSHTFTTSAAGFAAPTTAGNLLVCVIYASAQHTGGNLLASIGITGPTTSGITWSGPAFSPGYQHLTGENFGKVNLYYMANAPSIGTGVTTTASANGIPNTTTTYDMQVEFELYEFSGVKTSSPVDDTTADVGSASAPDAAPLIPTGSGDLLISAYTGDPAGGGAVVTAGSGYTLGINTTVSVFGQMQWQANVSGSPQSTAFGSSLPGNWGAQAFAFLPQTPPPASTVWRHR